MRSVPMENMLFMDMEFTGLHKNTKLLSIAVVDGFGNKFYGCDTSTDILMEPYLLERDKDFINGEILPLMADNEVVDSIMNIDKVEFQHNRNQIHMLTTTDSSKDGSVDYLGYDFCMFLELIREKKYHNKNSKFTIVTDLGVYDWVLFCELFGHSFDIPEIINYIPLDLATILHMSKWVNNSDASRHKLYESFTKGRGFNSIVGVEHHALMDAIMIREIFRTVK